MATLDPGPEVVAAIIADRENADFVCALMVAAGAFAGRDFEAKLAEHLRARADLVARWMAYSADQRWTPAAYVNGTEAGWFDSDRRDIVKHPDEAAAVADFIRRTAMDLASNRVEVPNEPQDRS